MKTPRQQAIQQVVASLGLKANENASLQNLLSTIDTVTANGSIFSKGDIAEHLFLISESQTSNVPHVTLQTSQREGAKSVGIDRLFEGFFGELEFLARAENNSVPDRMFSCIAIAPIKLIRIPYRTLFLLDPDDLSRVERTLSRASIQCTIALSEKLWISRTADNLTQLAHAILSLAEEAGVVEGRGRRISFGVTQQDLANEVGISREAVNAHLVEWDRAGLVQVSTGQIRVPDIERFRQIVESGLNTTRRNLQAILASIDRSLAVGDHFRARNLALDSLKFFPNSVELMYRTCLAAFRAGSFREAGAILDDLISANHFDLATLKNRLRDGLLSPRRNRKSATQKNQEIANSGDDVDDHEDLQEVERATNLRAKQLLEDVLAARGRLLKEAAFLAPSSDSKELMLAAARAYEHAHQASRGSFTAINAASLYFMANERARAAELADIATRECGNAPDYWSIVTKAEAMLLLGKLDDARRGFSKARRAQGCSPGTIATTRKQILRLASSLGMTREAVSSLLPQMGILTYSGHLPPTTGCISEEQFAATREQVLKVISTRSIGMAYGALAAGGDQICAQAALDAKVSLQVVLPWHVEDFRRTSVPQTQHTQDLARYETLLAGAASLRVLAPERVGSMRAQEMDERLHFANRQCLGLALLRADELEAEAFALAVFDHAGSGTRGGTAQFVRDCELAGVEIDIIKCPWKHEPDAPRRASRAQEHNLYSSVIFAGINAGAEKRKGLDPQTLSRRMLVAAGISKSEVARALTLTGSNAGTSVHAFAKPTTSAAVEFARALHVGANRQGLEISLLCDFGPIRSSDGSTDQARVKRLTGADAGMALPTDMVLASEAFAAEARLTLGSKVRFAPVGRLSPASSMSRRSPLASTPFYRLFAPT